MPAYIEEGRGLKDGVGLDCLEVGCGRYGGGERWRVGRVWIVLCTEKAEDDGCVLVRGVTCDLRERVGLQTKVLR